jgi:hypothetical protein
MSEIKVEVLAHSISHYGQEIVTYVLEYPRFIHSELMTHRMFSRNAASSRAIPIEKMINLIEENPATPTYWGLNQSGMQAGEEHSDISLCQANWQANLTEAVESATYLKNLGLHKQIVNRVLEPYQMIKVIVTATELDNFFWLRCHKDAQPEIKVLADKMYNALKESTPQRLSHGEWHLPYVATERDSSGTLIYKVLGEVVDLKVARKYSAACCAAVSYRTEDMTLEKAVRIYTQLIESEPCHASPVEHQATPIEIKDYVWGHDFPEGMTHIDREGYCWSNNFKGWIQNRALIPNNTCYEFNKQ